MFFSAPSTNCATWRDNRMQITRREGRQEAITRGHVIPTPLGEAWRRHCLFRNSGERRASLPYYTQLDITENETKDHFLVQFTSQKAENQANERLDVRTKGDLACATGIPLLDLSLKKPMGLRIHEVAFCDRWEGILVVQWRCHRSMSPDRSGFARKELSPYNDANFTSALAVAGHLFFSTSDVQYESAHLTPISSLPITAR